MNTFLGYGRHHVEKQYRKTGNAVYLHLRRIKKEVAISITHFTIINNSEDKHQNILLSLSFKNSFLINFHICIVQIPQEKKDNGDKKVTRMAIGEFSIQ